MLVHRFVAVGSAGAIALVTVAGAGASQAATKTAMDKAGAYCMQFRYPGPGATRSVLSLDIDLADHPSKQKLWLVGGVEKATNPDVAVDNYVNTLVGTATLAKPNNSAPGAKRIHMALNGTSYGSDVDPSVTGVWELAYNLQLQPQSLKGRVIGLSRFTPVAADGTPGATVTYAINAAVKPVSCKKA